MKTHSVFFLTLGIVAVVSLVCVWFIPSVQDLMAGNALWNGVKSFSRQFGANQIQNLNSLPADPEKSVVISVPYLSYTGADTEALRSYVERGGTLLLADDYGFGNQILTAFGLDARFDGNPLLDPLFCYKNQWMPKITDFPSSGNFKQVLLNHATSLVNVPDSEVMAWTSTAAFIDFNGNQTVEDNEVKGRLPVAAKLPCGKGTVLLLGDPSVIINTMINRADNLAFVRSLIFIGGDKQVFLDISHLSQTPLDTAKTSIGRIRETLAQPYAVLALFMVVFAGVAVWMMGKGGSVAKQSENR